MYLWLADAVVLVHAAFVAFVALGGLLVWRWRRLAWVHVPAVVWGVAIEWTGTVCPLTPLENWLRTKGSGAGYGGDFIQRYVIPALYPAALTREAQIVLGALALLVNVCAYWWIWRHPGVRRRANPSRRP